MAKADGYGMVAKDARKPNVDSGKYTKPSPDSGKPAANK